MTTPELHQPSKIKRLRRALLLTCAACALLAAVLAALFWPEAKALLLWGKDLLIALVTWVREAGPGWFFGAFAILPSFGVPISLFTFTAAPTFAPQIGLGWVIVLTATSLTLNLALSYWLARYALHPVVEALVKKLGYSLPEVSRDEHASLAILLRVVPGPPYAVQSYILGLAKVRFWVYMLISFIGQFGWALAAIFFGDALMKGGSGKTGFIALTLVIALVIGTRMLRKRYAKKNTLKNAPAAANSGGGNRDNSGAGEPAE